MSESPGGKALETMQIFNKTLSGFKKPAVPRRKPKMKILSEEQYIEELSKIIQRDFFPDLEKLKAQNEYLDAFEKNDVVKLREIYAKYSGKRPRKTSGGQSPATFETPVSSCSHTSRTKDSTEQVVTKQSTNKDENPLTIAEKHSLDSFLRSYTSEDNYSFQEIIETADEKLRQKFSILYNEEKISSERLVQALTLPSIEKQFNAIENKNEVDTWTYRNKNFIMYIPDGVVLTKEEQIDMINRKQEISYNNTRLSKNPFDEHQNKEAITELAKSQAKHLNGKIGVDGNVVEENMQKIRGFDFVKTPSPCPGETCSPLMTWGEIEGTPFRLDGSDTPIRASIGPSFRINETSRREVIALELAEKAGERMRGQKQKAIDAARRNISTPQHLRSSIERLASMSPAAKRLATMKLGLRSSIMTPSPRLANRLTTKPTPSPSSSRKRTPFVITPRQISEQLSKSDLTDDLLKIPSKRPKASDFF